MDKIEKMDKIGQNEQLDKLNNTKKLDKIWSMDKN